MFRLVHISQVYFLNTSSALKTNRSLAKNIAWKPMADDHDGITPKLPSFSPEEFFGGWTAKYRSLEWLPLDLHGDVNFPRHPDDLVGPPGHWPEGHPKELWWLDRERYETERALMGLYLECGWGSNFRKEEFEQRRQRWREEIFEPMEERLLEGFAAMQDQHAVQS